MHFKYGVVLTGGIASGKSSVARILKQKGYEIIDADEVAHRILQESVKQIEEKFGNEIVVDNRVDREKLGRIVFSDAVKRKQLEEILHPKIFDAINHQAKELEQKKQIYFLDIPLFFETGGRERYPVICVVSVYVDKQTQIERLMIRNNMSKEDAIRRVESQIPLEEKIRQSDYVLENQKDFQWLEKEVQKFLVSINTRYKSS